MFVILMGAQGSGKGTQAALLGPELGLMKIATGDLFRAEIASGSDLGNQLRTVLDRGDLVQDDLTNAIVRAKISALVDERAAGGEPAGALFDGFPRTANQAVSLDGILADFDESLTVVIEIDVPRDVLVDRLSKRRVCVSCGTVFHTESNPTLVDGVCDRCGSMVIQRDDDKPEPIARRLALYDAQTAPLLAYYRDKGILVSVDGNRSVDLVHDELMTVIRERATS